MWYSSAEKTFKNDTFRNLHYSKKFMITSVNVRTLKRNFPVLSQ